MPTGGPLKSPGPLAPGQDAPDCLFLVQGGVITMECCVECGSPFGPFLRILRPAIGYVPLRLLLRYEDRPPGSL